MGPKSAKSAKYRVFCGYTWKIPCDRLGIVPISSILRQILPQTSSQTQGNSRVSRMEHQTPSVFPGNFRKRKVLATLCFPFCLAENLGQAKAQRTTGQERERRDVHVRELIFKDAVNHCVCDCESRDFLLGFKNISVSFPGGGRCFLSCLYSY